jgi:hypothetical protein
MAKRLFANVPIAPDGVQSVAGAVYLFSELGSRLLVETNELSCDLRRLTLKLVEPSCPLNLRYSLAVGFLLSGVSIRRPLICVPTL